MTSPSTSVWARTAREKSTAFLSTKSQSPCPMWKAAPTAAATVILVRDGANALRETKCSFLISTVRQISGATNIYTYVYSRAKISVCRKFPLQREFIKKGTAGGYEFHAASVLENLIEVNNTLNVYSQDANSKEMQALVEFVVDTDFQSPFLVLSTKNITYTKSEVPLTYVYNEETTRSAYH